MPDDDIVEVIITAPDEDWLLDFTRQLVEKHLAAGGHHSPIRSIYTWGGATHDEDETRVALHTRASHVQAIIEVTNAAHPYEVPCVVSLPITNANPAYQAWVLDATN